MKELQIVIILREKIIFIIRDWLVDMMGRKLKVYRFVSISTTT